MPVILRHDAAASFSGRCGMRIIETDQACAGLVVHSKAVAQPMRSLRTRRHLLDDEPGPVIADGIDGEGFTIEVKQDGKARIAALGHGRYLSANDNLFKDGWYLR